MTISDIHTTETLSISDDQLKMLCIYARNTYLTGLDHIDPHDELFEFEYSHLGELKIALAVAGKYLWDDPRYYILEDVLSPTETLPDIQDPDVFQCLVAAARVSWHVTHQLLDDFQRYASLKVYRESANSFFEKE